ncbi:hypothetical protein [Paenibacillus jamilae]|uniref:hypothetical protein n=1 Tax=Paenibacillus jamilae TaxID=114136 RepID=UPI001428BDCF|nr:hypothetical protein [Paenibacillus jamilae]
MLKLPSIRINAALPRGGIIALILGYKYLPKSGRHEAPNLDVIGMCPRQSPSPCWRMV